MKLPHGHTIVLSIDVDGQPDRVIGTTRTTADVPALLRAVALVWEQHGPEMREDPDGYDGAGGWRPDFS